MPSVTIKGKKWGLVAIFSAGLGSEESALWAIINWTIRFRIDIFDLPMMNLNEASKSVQGAEEQDYEQVYTDVSAPPCVKPRQLPVCY